MYICDVCGKTINANQGNKVITRKDIRTGKQLHICSECFKEDMGVDYDVYEGRAARSKIMFYGVPLGVIITIFLFIEYGVIPGLIGIMLTYFVYKVTTQED